MNSKSTAVLLLKTVSSPKNQLVVAVIKLKSKNLKRKHTSVTPMTLEACKEMTKKANK